MQPASVSTVKRQNGIRATPAGQRDERADDRQHAGEEDGRVAVALEPAVGPVEVALLDVQLLAVLLEDVHAAEVADPVGDPGARPGWRRDPTAVAANRLYSPLETLKPANSIVASLGIGMHALSSEHQEEDSREPHRVHDVHGRVDDRVRDRGEHGHRAAK